jgi:hypothetical protein
MQALAARLACAVAGGQDIGHLLGSLEAPLSSKRHKSFTVLGAMGLLPRLRRHHEGCPMAKKSKIIGDELVLIAKAIRRGEKLERTLTKLAVVQETGSGAETFLKAVQKGLERLRKEGISADASRKAPERANAVKQQTSEERVAAAAAKRARKTKKPAPLESADAKSASPADQTVDS